MLVGTSSLLPRTRRLLASASHFDMMSWRRKPLVLAHQSAVEAPSSPAPWLATDADVGITRVSASAAKSEHCSYEISLRFPQTRTLWLIQRSYTDFQRFHAAIESIFHQVLHARRIQLPKPSRLGWDAFRAQSARTAAADKLRKQLNSYLHKLLEIESVHASDAFRDFVTPRPESDDSEVVQEDCADKVEGSSSFRRLGSSSTSTTSTSTTVSSRDSVDGLLLDMPAPFPWRVPPPVVAPSTCDELVHFGGTIALTALGGLSVGLTKRSALSGSQKAAAVAAGVAGVALTGPLSAVFALSALGGGVGKYQLNKASYLSVCKPSHGDDDTGIAFVVENAEQFSGPRRAARFGDAIHLYCRKVRRSVRIIAAPDSKRGHAMVSGGDAHKTTLRLVSPYGHTGPLRCGSQVFMQLVDGEWAGQLLGMHGEFITATKYSPTVFQLGTISSEHVAVDCPETATKTEQQERLSGPFTVPRSAIPFKLRVMVYNVWLLPGFVSSFNEKVSPWASQRASAIPRCLASLNVDVVVFCEAFCSSAREKLVSGMKSQGFIYETKIVGDVSLLSSKKAIDGGCFAMSKYPLSNCEEVTFGNVASGEDRYADKGVIYFQVRVPVKSYSGSDTTQTVHIVGTHLQAWETSLAVATRKGQMTLMRNFVNSLRLPKHEPVIYAGDMNVNKHADGAQIPEGEYTGMLDLLGVDEPQLQEKSPIYSFDPHSNDLAVDGPSSGGIAERLDYVMVDRSHRLPVSASTEIVQLKATKNWAPSRGAIDEILVDLSDHYPVVGDFHF
ncbi:PX domain-containing protein [Phytophthora infestans]|nr:PX domain-containing protein [Phytophthora infestans]